MKVLNILLLIILFSCATGKDINRAELETKMGIENEESSKPHVGEKGNDFSNIEKYLEEAEKEADLFKSYKLYQKAINEARKVNYPLEEIEFKLSELNTLLDVAVEYNSNLDQDLSEFITGEISKLGYKTSDIGFLTLNVELTTDSVILKNDYYNKIWNITVTLLDSKNSVINSEFYSSRESQISEEFLDTTIVLESQKVLKKLIQKVFE